MATMSLNKKDILHLAYMERWGSYNISSGALDISEVISEDHKKGGGNFSTFLSDDDTKVKSFGYKNIPEADIMLVWGNSPRALEYAAEIAVRYRDKYGNFPYFLAIGDGKGMYRQRCEMADWYAEKMVHLGFPEDWVMQYKQHPCEITDDKVFELKISVRKFGCKHKPRVLLITGNGYSMYAAQVLVPQLPEMEFLVFETPTLEQSAKLFDSEVFDINTYAVDKILANVVLSFRRDPGKQLGLPVEKLLDHPRSSIIVDLLLRGYCGYFGNHKMWKLVKIDPETGMKLYNDRHAMLQQVIKPNHFFTQEAVFMNRILKKLEAKGLLI